MIHKLFTDCHCLPIDPHELFRYYQHLYHSHKKIKLWLKLKHHQKMCGNKRSSYLIFFLILIGAHSQTEASRWSWPSPPQREWYSFNYCTRWSSRREGLKCHAPMMLVKTIFALWININEAFFSISLPRGCFTKPKRVPQKTLHGDDPAIYCVLEIGKWLRIPDAEPSSNFLHKLYYIECCLYPRTWHTAKSRLWISPHGPRLNWPFPATGELVLIIYMENSSTSS